jgi:peptidoglycan/LPS O-acetylase OafA/YrhL
MVALTSMRGIAALGVVLFHIDVCLFYREMGTLLPKASSGLIANGYLWVDFFFILSGFVIYHAYAERLGAGFRWRTAASYYRSRFFRIYPLHFVLTLLLVAAVVVGGLAWPSLKDGSWDAFFKPSALPANLLMLHAMTPGVGLTWNIVSWSIAAEWWVYAAAPLLIPVLARCGLVAGILCIAAGTLAMIGLYLAVGRQTLDITFDYGVIRCLGGFLIGLGLYRLQRSLPPLSPAVTDGLALSAFAGIVPVMHFDANDLLIVPLFALLVVTGASARGRLNRVLASAVPHYLGRISYSTYLVHGLVFMLFWFGAPAWGLSFQTPLAAWILALVFLAVTFAGAALTYRFIERPAQALGHWSIKSAPMSSEV